ncbi:MAG: hypothetical protein K1X83_04540 [Oligoflexia bacterium]|nr:hypothetical protein [Oligoflexia bacterium]
MPRLLLQTPIPSAAVTTDSESVAGSLPHGIVSDIAPQRPAEIPALEPLRPSRSSPSQALIGVAVASLGKDPVAPTTLAAIGREALPGLTATLRSATTLRNLGAKLAALDAIAAIDAPETLSAVINLIADGQAPLYLRRRAIEVFSAMNTDRSRADADYRPIAHVLTDERVPMSLRSDLFTEICGYYPRRALIEIARSKEAPLEFRRQALGTLESLDLEWSDLRSLLEVITAKDQPEEIQSRVTKVAGLQSLSKTVPNLLKLLGASNDLEQQDRIVRALYQLATEAESDELQVEIRTGLAKAGQRKGAALSITIAARLLGAAGKEGRQEYLRELCGGAESVPATEQLVRGLCAIGDWETDCALLSLLESQQLRGTAQSLAGRRVAEAAPLLARRLAATTLRDQDADPASLHLALDILGVCGERSDLTALEEFRTRAGAWPKLELQARGVVEQLNHRLKLQRVEQAVAAAEYDLDLPAQPDSAYQLELTQLHTAVGRDPQDLNLVTAALDSPYEQVRLEAAGALIHSSPAPARALAICVNSARDSRSDISESALRLLMLAGSASAASAVLETISDPVYGDLERRRSANAAFDTEQARDGLLKGLALLAEDSRGSRRHEIESYTRALASCAELKITQPFRFKPDDLIAIVNERLRPDPLDRRPVMLVTMARDDYNGFLFGFSEKLHELMPHYRVRYFEASDDPELLEVLSSNTEESNQAEIVIMAGHGKKRLMRLGSGTEESQFFDLGDADRFRAANAGRCLKPGGTVYLVSCAVGTGANFEGEADNLVNCTRTIFPHAAAGHVIGARDSTWIRKLEIARDGRLKDIRFSAKSYRAAAEISPAQIGSGRMIGAAASRS